MAATLGVIFTDSRDAAVSTDLTTNEGLTQDNIYFPVKAGSGYWEGDYVHGEANLDTEQVRDHWNDDPNAPFSHGSNAPRGEGDENIYDRLDLKYPTPASNFTNMYLITAANLKKIANYLNNSDDALFEQIKKQLSLSGTDLYGSIVNIMACPIPVTTGGVSPIVIGKALIPDGSGGAVSGGVINSLTVEVDFGSVQIPKYNRVEGEGDYPDYLLYEPYTRYVCWFPFCGYVELEASVIVGKKLSFYLNCDLATGTCEGQICIGAKSNVYKTIGGTFGT